MWRRKQDLPEDVASAAQRLRDERPQATPLELDQVKTTAMSRAGAKARGASTSRRLVASSLVVGLMAAGTGGVIAAGSSGGATGDAATSQYSTTTVTTTITSPGAVNIGNGNTCVFVGNNNTLTCIIGGGAPPTVTVSVITTTASASSAVLGASTSVTASQTVQAASTTVPAKGRVSKRFLVVSHLGFPTNKTYKTLVIKINGKTYKFKENGKLPAAFNFAGVACTAANAVQVVKITATTSTGKSYTTTRTYHLCVPGPTS